MQAPESETSISVSRPERDLFFALAVPAESTQEHLDILATLAGMFSDELLVAKLRSIDSADDIFQLVTGWTDAA